MQNKTGINSNALHYRIFTKGVVGTLVIIAAGVLITIILNVLKLQNALTYSLLAIVGVFILQFLLVFSVSYLEYKNLKYVIEPNSISLQRGTFSIETETIPFEKIKNSSFDQTLVQRFFGVGDIIIDQDDEKFIWASIDMSTANQIMEAVSAKSNVQPITVQMASANNPSTGSPKN